MDISLSTQSRMWHEEADKLLDDSQLYALLSNVGDVRVTGSYEYDLMLGADIDIYVIVPAKEARTSALRALKELITQNYWNGYLFYDFVEHSSKHHANFPKSYYVGVKADYSVHRWKVDVWFGDESTLSENNSWIKQSLSEGAKNIILQLKEARNKGLLKADSHLIYEAVLRNNIKGIADFKQWVISRA